MFYTRTFRLAAVTILAFPALTACVDANGGRTWVEPDSDFYVNLASLSNDDSNLVGIGVRSGESGGFDIVQGSGTYGHAAGSYAYNDGKYSFTSSAGFVGGVIGDGNGASLLDASSNYDGQFYDFVIPVVFNYSDAGANFTTNGFLGIQTENENMPTSGTASFYGDAIGTVIAHSNFYEFSSGSSRVVANFGTNVVEMELTGFTVTDGESSVISPFDTVAITGMTITDNSFSGGEIVSYQNGTSVNITGDNTVSNSKGTFFGWNYVDDIPAEVAGVFVSEGSSGQMVFTFIAD